MSNVGYKYVVVVVLWLFSFQNKTYLDLKYEHFLIFTSVPTIAY